MVGGNTVASTGSTDASLVSVLQSQIDQLLQSQQDMKSHIYTLESNYRSVLDEMAAFQQGMASQDALIQNLLQHLVNFEQRTEFLPSYPYALTYHPFAAKRPGDSSSNQNGSIESNFVSEEAQRMMSTSSYNPHDVARASLQQLTELSRRANRSNIPMGPVPPPSQPSQLTSLPHLQTSNDLGLGPSSQSLSSPSSRGPAAIVQSPIDWSNHQGLQVLTVGHLLPRTASSGSSPDDMEIEEQVLPSATYQSQTTPVTANSSSGSASSNRLRVRRKTYVPGWAVPPRVLLVEDDAVSRKLSSKFLQVLGVTADVAVDGDAAVKQMCLERYDLVLMVRPCSFISFTR